MSNAWLTQSDVDSYGPELTDFSQRAALHAIEPKLQLIAEDNAMLRNRLAVEARHRLDAQVERAVPNYREIDRMPGWHQYLRGVDPLSGRARQFLLNDAIQSGSATRVIAFFRGFQEEAGGTAAATSRTRSSSPSGKPTYTRQQIGQLYEAHRKGAYNGREAEWQRVEQDFFDAQRDGRVVGPDYITK